MFPAHDIRHSFQFFAGPNTARRVMRIAEQEHIRLFGFGLEVFPIDLEAVIAQHERGNDQFATHVLYTGEETVIRRREGEDTQGVMAHLEGRKDGGDSRYDGGGVEQVGRVDSFPSVFPFEP